MPLDETTAVFEAGTWLTSPHVIEVRSTLAVRAPFQRSQILRTVAPLIRERSGLLASLLSDEAGKPIRDARTEVERSVMTFRVVSEEAERLGGEVLDLGINKTSRGRLGLTRRFQAGIVAGITPFNLPVSLSAHKLAPAGFASIMSMSIQVGD